jgi:hypothetical protein
MYPPNYYQGNHAYILLGAILGFNQNHSSYSQLHGIVVGSYNKQAWIVSFAICHLDAHKISLFKRYLVFKVEQFIVYRSNDQTQYYSTNGLWYKVQYKLNTCDNDRCVMDRVQVLL